MAIANILTEMDKIKMAIPCCKTYEFVNLHNIIRCEGLQNYCRVYLTDGSILTSTKSIGYFKEKLTKQSFGSCHRSHVVNLDQVVRYNKEGSIELKDQSVVPVSRRMKEDFLIQLMDNMV